MCKATENAATKLTFETETCNRCGGSGRYSFCQTMNGKFGPYTCFKCLGSGVRFTKRGAAASALLERAYSKPAEDLKAGDLIRDGRKWERVVRAYQQTPEDNAGYAITPEGPRYYFAVETETGTYCGFEPRKLYRVAQSAERKAEVMPLVAEYQDLLTKTGAPRKNAAARAAEIMLALGLD